MSETRLPEFWKTYVGLVAAAAFVAYIFLVENKREPAGDDEPKEKVFAADPAKVREVTIARTDGETLRVAREGAQWRLEEPLQAAADTAAVESLIQSLEGAQIQDEVSKDGTSLAGFGLDKPRLRVSLAREGGSPTVLLIGNKLVDGTGVYAKTEARPRVFTLASFLEASLDKKAFDLRDRDVLKVKRDAVASLQVEGPEGAYTLARDAKGEWAFTKPVATKAGRWAVDGLLGSLENLRMDAVAAEDAKDMKPYGLDKPARRVTLGLVDGAMRTLEIGKETAEKKYPVRVEGQPLVALVPATLSEDLAKGMANLRAKRLLEVATYDVAGFDATEGGATKTFEKTTTKDKDGLESSMWKRTAPDAKDLETSKVEDALFKIGGVEAQEFVDAPKADAEYGLDAPVFRLSLRMAEGKPGSEIAIGRRGDLAYARRSGDAAVLKVEKAKADELIEAFKGL